MTRHIFLANISSSSLGQIVNSPSQFFLALTRNTNDSFLSSPYATSSQYLKQITVSIIPILTRIQIYLHYLDYLSSLIIFLPLSKLQLLLPPQVNHSHNFHSSQQQHSFCYIHEFASFFLPHCCLYWSFPSHSPNSSHLIHILSRSLTRSSQTLQPRRHQVITLTLCFQLTRTVP